MRIVQVFSTPYPPTEGISTYVHELTRELSRAGHEVTLVTRGDRTRTTRLPDLGVDLLEVRTPSIHPFHVHAQEILFRREAKKRWGADVLYHLHTPYPPLPPRGSRCIVTVHTSMIPDSSAIPERTPYALAQKAQSRFLRGREERIFRAAKVLTAVSAGVAGSLAEYGVDPASVIVTGNGVDETRFQPVPNPARDYFLYTGRLGPRKGLEDLIAAASILAEEKREFKLKLTGRGPLEEMLKQRVRDAGLTAQVEFLGLVPKDDLPALYANARACVIPSHYEGLPTVLLEAMASGTPVVATDIPGIREVVPTESRAHLVAAGDASGLARALEDKLLAGSGLSLEGQRSRARILERHTWTAVARRYQELYASSGG